MLALLDNAGITNLRLVRNVLRNRSDLVELNKVRRIEANVSHLSGVLFIKINSLLLEPLLTVRFSLLNI